MAQSKTKASRKNWERIKRADRFDGSLDDDNIIGSGRFGEVFRYEDSAGNLFALKRIRLPNDLDQYDLPPTDIENIELLLSLKHKNIVRLFRVERGKRQIYLFLELMRGGNLQQLIETRKKKNKVLSEQTVQAYATQMLLGLQYLHARQIVHRDVKPANVLLNSKKTVVKLTDFSLSELISTTSGKETRTARGTYHYMAPEVVRCERFSTKSDIWSLGATLVEMLTGNPPYSNVRNDATLIKLLCKLGKKELSPDYETQDLSTEAEELLEKILQPFPGERPSVAALLALDYFSLENVEDLESDFDNEKEYPLKENYKGRTLIINNVNYLKEKHKRVGAKVDENRLKETLEAIGFKVVPAHTDLTATAMIHSIKAFASDKENKNYSSFIIVIMAHGNDKGVLGVDEKELPLKEIVNAFSSNGTQLLSSKPKILIIQACRSNKLNEGATQNESAGKSAKTRSPTKPVNVKKVFESDEAADRRRSTSKSSLDSDAEDLDEDSAVTEFASSKSDILVAYSTCKGYKAYRDTNDGTIFIQGICDEVQKYWQKMSLLDILAIVNGQVASAVFTKSGETLTQIPQVKSTLSRRFFLSHTSERKATTKRTGADQKSNAQQKDANKTASSSSNAKPSTSAKSSSRQSESATNAPKYSKRSQQKQILVLAGGGSGAVAYDPSSDTWATVASMSCERWGVAATLWQGKVVVAGGYNDTNGWLKTVEQYDPESNSWTALPDMLHERSGLALACLDNSLYAIGGQDGTSCLASVERFDSTKKRWILAATLNVKRWCLCCAVLGVKILTIGGTSDGSNTLDSCEMLDGATQTWQLSASLQTARDSASASTVDEKVYVFGGAGKDNKKLDSVEEYAAGKWTLLPVRLSVARNGLAAATVDGRVYVCGGYPDKRVVECFDASKRTISRVAQPPKDFWGAGAASVTVSDQVWSRLFRLVSD